MSTEALLYRFAEFELDPLLFQLRRGAEPVELTRQAFELLLYLIEHRDRVVSRTELLEELWSDRVVTDNALSQAVAAVRRALGESSAETRFIETVYGRGFRFVAEIETGREPPPAEEETHDDAAPAAADGALPAGPEPERAELARAFGPMLFDLCGDMRPVRLFAATRQASDAEEVSIVSVYTSLEIDLEVTIQKGGEAAPAPKAPSNPAAADRLALAARIRSALQGDLEREASARSTSTRRYRRRVRAVESVAISPRLVILGPPGSGKSTFVQHLALCLAGSILGNSEATIAQLRNCPPEAPRWMPWEQRPVLPIFVELAQFVSSTAFPGPRTEGTASQLFAYLALREAGRSQQIDALERYLQEREGEGVLLILDGLDETPLREGEEGKRDLDSTRERLKQVIRSFVNRFAKARVILTSRPYAYEPGSPWRLDAQGFDVVELAPFSREQVRTFCRHWYVGMAERRVIAHDQIEQRATSLAAELDQQEYLRPIAERPLTLTMIADLHTQDGVLATSRAALYEESAILFLNRWNAARRSERPGENRLTVELRIGLEELRHAIDHLAYEAQCIATGPDAAVLSAGKVIDVLFEHGAKGEAERVLDFLSERSGILVSDSRHRYRFPHRTYQEYLASCYLTYRDFPGRLIESVRSDPERWREVLPLAFGRVRHMPFMAIALIEQLLAPDTTRSAQHRHLLGYLCASGVEEAGLRKTIGAQSPRTLELLHGLLLAGIEHGSGSERDRVHAAETLGQLGDPRVERLERVPVTGGRFWIGAQRDDPEGRNYAADAWAHDGPVHEVEIAPFEMTRYPVTVSQYAVFVAEGGYKERRFWSPAGWAWLEQNKFEAPFNWTEQLAHPNRPVVGLSWYEADACCRWAGGRLPTEAEWEYVATGGGRTRCPWGDEEPTEQHAAFGERLTKPTPVGIYPQGISQPWGFHDLMSNVCTWTQDPMTVRYGAKLRPEPEPRVRPIPRTGRGAWYGAPTLWCRASRRLSFAAELRDNDVLGFRIAWPSQPVEEEPE